MRISIYLKEEDRTWLKELHKYAKENKWSVSLAIRELLSRYFEVNPVSNPVRSIEDLSDIRLANTPEEVTAIENKIDPDTYFAQVESKLVKAGTGDIDRQMAECIKEKTNSKGEISCYFFDNAKEYHPFCKQYCWTRKDIWKNRVRL